MKSISPVLVSTRRRSLKAGTAMLAAGAALLVSGKAFAQAANGIGGQVGTMAQEATTAGGNIGSMAMYLAAL